MRTRQQEWAEKAYQAVTKRRMDGAGEDYARICKTFPALIHNSGLCQAVAFAQAKDAGSDGKRDTGQYLDDLAGILGMDREVLAQRSRGADVLTYQRLTWDALAVASWMKRYAEALLEDEKDQGKAGSDASERVREG